MKRGARHDKQLSEASVRRFLVAYRDPNITLAQLSARFGLADWRMHAVAEQHGVPRRLPKRHYPSRQKAS